MRGKSGVAKCFILLLSLVLTSSSRSAERAATAPSTQAAHAAVQLDPADKDAVDAAVGKEVVVTGVITSADWSRSGKVMTIEFKGNEKSRFEAVVFLKSRPNLDKKFDGDAAAKLKGATVKVRGKLSTYTSRAKDAEKRPQIVIDKVEQIELVRTP